VIPSKVFDAAAALEAMTLQRASIIVATRDQLVRLASTAASAPKGMYDLSSLRTGLVGEWNTAPVSFKYRFTTVSLPPRHLHQKDTYDLSSDSATAVDSDGGTSAFDGLAVLGTKAVGL
jgi:hypothetical protein